MIQNNNDNLTTKDSHTGVSKLDEEHLVILVLSHSVPKDCDVHTATVQAIDLEQERNLHSQVVNISCEGRNRSIMWLATCAILLHNRFL